jgi:hypothetical protein
MKKLLIFAFVGLALILSVGGVSPIAASGLFLEPEVVVLQTFTGENIGDGFGWVAENLGDINGDGANDLIIPAPFNGENGAGAGKVYIFSGKDGGLLHSVLGNPGENLGYSASTAGDVNADGVPDYVAGGPGGGSVPGRVAVYSGADHSLIREWFEDPSLGFGSSVAGAGDVNGDGFGDILVGAPLASFSFLQAGRVYVFSGEDGEELWTRDGNSENSLLGSGAGKVGLLDNDDAPDLVAGAPGAGRAGTGEAYVYSGSSGSTLFTLRPANPGTAQQFGTFFASGAGDVNADGVPDIFIGDYNDSRGGGVGTGRAYIFSGADGSRLHVFNAEDRGEGFGPGRGAGDVDRDGLGDVYIGAYTNSDGAQFGGKGYLYSGRDGSRLRTMTGNADFEFLGVDALPVGDVNGDHKIDFLLTGVNFAGTGLDHTYLIAGN